MKINPSLLKRVMRCPLEYKLSLEFEGEQKVSGAMQYGTEVHAALESLLEGAPVEDVRVMFLANWDKAIDIIDYYHNRTSWEGYRAKGLDVIEAFYSERVWGAKELVGTEHRFHAPFGVHSVSGIVDFIEYDSASDTLFLEDFKTGSRPNKNQLHVDVQLGLYFFSSFQREFWVGWPETGERYKGFPNGEELFERFRHSKRRIVWYDLRNNREYDAGQRSQTDFLRLHRTFDEMERAFELDVFVPNISWENCGYCDFKDVCPAYSPAQVELNTKHEFFS